MVRIFVTDHTAYFMDGEIRGKQYFFCLGKPFFCEVTKGRHPIKRRKLPAQAVAAHSHSILEVFQGKFLFIVIIKKIPDLCKIPGRFRLYICPGAAGSAKTCKDRSQILVHQKKVPCIRGFRKGKKRLDAPAYGRSLGQGKTAAAFSKKRSIGGKSISADKKQLEIPWQHNGLQGKILAAVETDEMFFIGRDLSVAGSSDPSASHGSQQKKMAIHGRKTKRQR